MTKLFWFVLALSALLPAQRREFLTDGEVDKVREAQEPNDRVKLYAKFAAIRMDAIDKEMETESAGRSARIHDLMYEFERIADAMDAIASGGITRQSMMRKGLSYCVETVPDMLKRLQAIRDRNPADMEEYRFALNEAIETTDSAVEDLKKALAKQPKATAKELKEEEKERKKEKEEEQQQQKKKPSQ